MNKSASQQVAYVHDTTIQIEIDIVEYMKIFSAYPVPLSYPYPCVVTDVPPTWKKTSTLE